MSSCLENLPLCEASCCRSVSFLIDKKPKARGKLYFQINDLDDEHKRYYELHGFRVTGNVIEVSTGLRHTYKDGRLIVHKKCNALTKDNLCSVHEDKPTPCRDLDATTAKSGKYYLTPNCIFKR